MPAQTQDRWLPGKKNGAALITGSAKKTPKTVGLQSAEAGLPTHVVRGDPARAAVRGADHGVQRSEGADPAALGLLHLGRSVRVDVFLRVTWGARRLRDGGSRDSERASRARQ